MKLESVITVLAVLVVLPLVIGLFISVAPNIPISVLVPSSVVAFLLVVGGGILLWSEFREEKK